MLMPGTYAEAINNPPAGAPGAWNDVRKANDNWNVIKAAVDGTVIVTGGLGLNSSAHYLQIEGIKFQSQDQKQITGSFVKVLRSTFKGGPGSGNNVKLCIGTNDQTPGAHDILLEDVPIYGRGGRYDLLVYNSDRIVLRRVVGRHGAGWSDTAGDPQASVSIYNSSNVETQNMLLPDTVPVGYFEAVLYHPSNGSSSNKSNNIHHDSPIIFNCPGNQLLAYDDGVAATNGVVTNGVLFGGDYAININGAAHAGNIANMTILKCPKGCNDWKTSPSKTKLSNCISDTGGNMAQTGGIAKPVAMKYLFQSTVAGKGANIMTRRGKSGAGYGEPGWLDDDGPLWPWPMEDAIKADFTADSAVGFCAPGAPSLTNYLWAALGNTPPATF